MLSLANFHESENQILISAWTYFHCPAATLLGEWPENSNAPIAKLSNISYKIDGCPGIKLFKPFDLTWAFTGLSATPEDLAQVISSLVPQLFLQNGKNPLRGPWLPQSHLCNNYPGSGPPPHSWDCSHPSLPQDLSSPPLNRPTRPLCPLLSLRRTCHPSRKQDVAQ